MSAVLWHHLKGLWQHMHRPLFANVTRIDGQCLDFSYYQQEGFIVNMQGERMEWYECWCIPLPWKKSFFNLWMDADLIAWVDLVIFKAWPDPNWGDQPRKYTILKPSSTVKGIYDSIGAP